MLEKPRTLTTVGFIQVLLAASFVIWLLFFPALGGNFAWPVVPPFSAMFIGASFIVRAYIGYFLWREKYWPRLRWQRAGNLAFLIVILITTYWHIDKMNWKSDLLVVGIWLVAYTVEPIMLFLIEPRGEASQEPLPPEERRGPVLAGLKWVATVGLILSVAIGGLMFINPQFLNTRWPWPLDPFNSRIMAAFLALTGAWCATIYFSKEWAEVRRAVLGLAIFAVAHFGAWLVMLPRLDPARSNIYTYGILFGLFALSLVYYYVRQERIHALAWKGSAAGAGNTRVRS